MLMTDLYRSSLEFNLSACIECQVNMICMRFMKQSRIFKSLQTIGRNMACAQKILILYRWVPCRVDQEKEKNFHWKRFLWVGLEEKTQDGVNAWLSSAHRAPGGSYFLWVVNMVLVTEWAPTTWHCGCRRAQRALWNLSVDFSMMTIHADIGKRFVDTVGERKDGDELGD